MAAGGANVGAPGRGGRTREKGGRMLGGGWAGGRGRWLVLWCVENQADTVNVNPKCGNGHVVDKKRLVPTILYYSSTTVVRGRSTSTVVVTCSYYNTGNYATIEDRTTDDKQINYKVDPG